MRSLPGAYAVLCDNKNQIDGVLAKICASSPCAGVSSPVSPSHGLAGLLVYEFIRVSELVLLDVFYAIWASFRSSPALEDRPPYVLVFWLLGASEFSQIYNSAEFAELTH
ncbi:hypothetical protein ACS0TY_033423 [Phlomoides rotata]